MFKFYALKLLLVHVYWNNSDFMYKLVENNIQTFYKINHRRN